MSKEAMKLALEALTRWAPPFYAGKDARMAEQAITAIKQALALDKKAENARDLGLDYEPMLKDNSNYRFDPPVAEPVASAAYDMVDRFLRNNLSSDADYAEYSAALDALYTTPPAQPAPVQEPVAMPENWFAGMPEEYRKEAWRVATPPAGEKK